MEWSTKEPPSRSLNLAKSTALTNGTAVSSSRSTSTENLYFFFFIMKAISLRHRTLDSAARFNVHVHLWSSPHSPRLYPRITYVSILAIADDPDRCIRPDFLWPIFFRMSSDLNDFYARVNLMRFERVMFFFLFFFEENTDRSRFIFGLSRESSLMWKPKLCSAEHSNGLTTWESVVLCDVRSPSKEATISWRSWTLHRRASSPRCFQHVVLPTHRRSLQDSERRDTHDIAVIWNYKAKSLTSWL